MDNNKDSSPIPLGIRCLLTYLIPFFGGLVFLFIERENRLIRFHAVQSILFWIFFSIYGVIINSVIQFAFLRHLLQLLFLAVWVFVMYQALKERMYELPLVGDIVKQQAFGSNWNKGKEKKEKDKSSPRHEKADPEESTESETEG
ncbi:MAG: hypothetical protein JXB45_06085 [Candidatus Krumholzibacteriota bacterium]|nr:hypothetical protein [Candidatus Krumholzibacteriota bacterium]